MNDAAIPDAASRGLILVVDDQENNRQLLHDMLDLDGHEVLEAADGRAALDLALSRDPDAILLDVSMPGMDGFEVCRRLRDDPATTATPVLLITAMGEREDRLRGMAAGANDYLVKPIDRIEVSLRVRNAVRLRVMHRTVQRQLAELQRLERLRDDLVSMVAHDLRSPLTGLRGLLELLQEGSRDRPPAAVVDLLPDAVRTVDEINGMIGDMLDVSRLDAAALPLECQVADLQQLAMQAVARLGPRPSFHPVTVTVDGAATTVCCDVSLIRRVIVNLVANAVRFSPSNGTVYVSIGASDAGGTVRVRDEGPGIPASERERIFEKFTQLAGARALRSRSSGLGLTFCRMVIDAHGGQIGVTSTEGGGSEFWFSVPPADAGDDSAMK